MLRCVKCGQAGTGRFCGACGGQMGPVDESAETVLSPLSPSSGDSLPPLAIAGIEGYRPGDTLTLGREVTLRAGLLGAEAGASAQLSLPDDTESPAFDVLVEAEDMDVLPEDHQVFRWNPPGAGDGQDADQDLLRFTLIPKWPGRKRITVMFYHARRWLQNVVLEVDVAERTELH